MIPALYYQSQARMRLAFTQACVNFPRINVAPITSAIWEVYANEARSQGSTYVLLDPEVSEDVLDLTTEIGIDLVSKNGMARMMVGLGPDERAMAKVYCPGLGPVLGMEMLRYAQQYRKDKFELVRRRKLMLSDRRNKLANAFTDKVIQQAHKRLAATDRGGDHP